MIFRTALVAVMIFLRMWNEAELDAELEALGEEQEFEGFGAESTPSFMVDEVPHFIDEPPQTGDKIKEAAG